MTGILIDVNGDLVVQSGTLKIDDNKAQIVQNILICGQGELKHAPLLGCNLRKNICGLVDPFFAGNAKKQLANQGIVVNSIKIQGETINIDYK